MKVRAKSWLSDKTRGIENTLTALRQGQLKCSVLAPTVHAMDWMTRTNLQQALARQQKEYKSAGAVDTKLNVPTSSNEKNKPMPPLLHGGDLALRELYCGSGANCLGAAPRQRPVNNVANLFKHLAESDPSGYHQRAFVVESKYVMPSGPRIVPPSERTYQALIGGPG